MKVCIECGEQKKLSAFHRDKKWYRKECKECRNKMYRLYHYQKTHTLLLPCEKCWFEERCGEKIWDMNWWPYCMRKNGRKI